MKTINNKLLLLVILLTTVLFLSSCNYEVEEGGWIQSIGVVIWLVLAIYFMFRGIKLWVSVEDTILKETKDVLFKVLTCAISFVLFLMIFLKLFFEV